MSAEREEAGHPGGVDDYPMVVAVAEPRKITIKKGSFAEVTVNLTYKFKPIFDAPTKVTVQAVRPKGAYLMLGFDRQKMNEREFRERTREMYLSGKRDSTAFFDVGQVVSYPNSEPIELNAGETKSTAMKITIPEDIPDEIVGKGFMVNSDFSFDKRVTGMSVGVQVTVIT